MAVVLFDLDHTLIHTHATCLDATLQRFVIRLDDTCQYVHIRPHAVALLRYLVFQKWIRVGVWTAGTRAYGEAILDGLCRVAGIKQWKKRLAIFLSREHTKRTLDGKLYKDLNVARALLDTPYVILADDDPIHMLYNPPTCVMPVPRFHAGETKDVFLRDVRREFLRAASVRLAPTKCAP